MKNKSIIFILLFTSIVIGIGIYVYNNPKIQKEHNSYKATRTVVNDTSKENSNIVNNNQSEGNNISENEKENETSNSNKNNEITQNEKKAPPTTESQKEPVETEIASYTSKIRQKKDSDRQNNISVACSTLNDTIVKNGTTFSFCNTIGKTSKKKGYEEAKVFQDGKEVEAMGGGLCQVSSTLYNAVLKISNLDIIERHTHSKQVYYVPKGKDAAVAYGSYDFKFKNNTGTSLKIKASNTKNNVTIKILKIE